LATLTKPNIDIIPNEKDPSKSSIKFSNTGIEAATHMKLKIKYLKTFAITLVFSSENITFVNKTTPKLLEIYMPRFVQGPGSITQIDL
jgi:hypothetical protein